MDLAELKKLLKNESDEDALLFYTALEIYKCKVSHDGLASPTSRINTSFDNAEIFIETWKEKTNK